jgi:hypothetical protein
MMEILIATAFVGIALLWFSTKTGNIAFQKLFAAMGILLFAAVFLQASLVTPTTRLNATEHYTQAWECPALKGNCSGAPVSCNGFDEGTCGGIPGCTWEPELEPDPAFCDGVPTVTCEWVGAYDYYGDTCVDADGCTWSSDVVNATCELARIYQHYENEPGGEAVSAGNLALFTVFGILLVLVLVWFIIDYMGIGLNDLGQIVRKRPRFR